MRKSHFNFDFIILLEYQLWIDHQQLNVDYYGIAQYDISQTIGFIILDTLHFLEH